MALANRLMESPHLQKLINLPERQQYCLTLCLSGLLFLFAGYVWIWPERQINAELPLIAADLEQRFIKNQRLYESLDVNGMAAELKTAAQQLTPFIDMNNAAPKFAERINRHLNASQTRLTTLKSQPAGQKDDAVIHSWRLKIEGDYFQLVRFLTLLIEQTEPFIFDDLTVQKEQERLSLEFTVSLYQPINLT